MCTCTCVCVPLYHISPYFTQSLKYLTKNALQHSQFLLLKASPRQDLGAAQVEDDLLPRYILLAEEKQTNMLITILKEARNSCLDLVHQHSKYKWFRCKCTLRVGVSLLTLSEKTKEALAGFESLNCNYMWLTGILKWATQNTAFVNLIFWLLSVCSASNINMIICWEIKYSVISNQAELLWSLITISNFFFTLWILCVRQQLNFFLFFFFYWNLISLSALRWQLFLSNCSTLHAGINQPISVKHKHTPLISGIHTWLLPWLYESADVYPSRPECLTKILSGTMIHFALNSQDVCVYVCMPEFRLFEFVFVQPLKGNKHMKVQHNVFLDKQELQ